MATPESKVRDPVVKWAKAHGIGHIRMSFRPGVRQGIPDDLFLLGNGVAVFVEFKRAGKEPTPIQEARLLELEKYGFLAFWADESGPAIELLERVQRDVMLINQHPDQPAHTRVEQFKGTLQ